MSSTSDLLIDGFGRVQEVVHAVLTGLPDADLGVRPDDRGNPIAWLVWHLARAQDAQVAAAAGAEERWIAEGWVERFGLPFDRLATGYGQSPQEAGSVRAPAELLIAYCDAVSRATADYVRTLDDADLDRIVDSHWDPPVTLGVRLVSILADDLQHAGQASYVRGLLGH